MGQNKKAVEVKVETNMMSLDYMNDLHDIQDERMDAELVQELGASYEAFLSEFQSINLDDEFDYAY